MGLITEAIILLVKIPFIFFDHFTAHRKSQVVESTGVGSINADRPVLIYVHYSKYGQLTSREISTLSNIRQAGFQICIVVNKKKSQLYQKLETTAKNGTEFETVITRRNVGWDLGAYRDAFFLLKTNRKIQNQPIIFMNNSVIWFPDMVEDYFNNLTKEETNVIAASISNQYRPHIQTFLFGSLNSNGTNQIEIWLKSIKNWRLKKTVVSYGELGTRLILKSQIVCKSLPDYEKLQELCLKKIHEDFESKDHDTPYVVIKRLLRNRTFMHAGVPVNPSHDYWLELMESGFPGIKVDLVRENPSQISDYEIAIRKLLESGFDYQMISRLISSNKSKSLVFKVRRWLKL